MERDNLDIESLIENRQKAVTDSLKEVGVAELNRMSEQIFPYSGHPWEERFSSFLQENAGGTFYHAMAESGVHLVYCRDKEKGLWYRPGNAIGVLQKRALAVLREIVDNKK